MEVNKDMGNVTLLSPTDFIGYFPTRSASPRLGRRAAGQPIYEFAEVLGSKKPDLKKPDLKKPAYFLSFLADFFFLSFFWVFSVLGSAEPLSSPLVLEDFLPL